MSKNKGKQHNDKKPLVHPLTAVPILKAASFFQIDTAMRIAAARLEQRMYKDFGVGRRSAWILMVAYQTKMNQSKVADVLGINHNVMVDVLDELEEHHLLTRMRNPENRREHLLKLTDKGIEMAKELVGYTKAGDVYQEAFAPMTKGEVHQLACSSRKIIDAAYNSES